MQYYCDVVSKKTINNVGFFSTEGTVITLSEGEDVTHSADFVKGTLPTDYAYTYYKDNNDVWHKKLVLNGTITNRVNNALFLRAEASNVNLFI